MSMSCFSRALVVGVAFGGIRRCNLRIRMAVARSGSFTALLSTPIPTSPEGGRSRVARSRVYSPREKPMRLRASATRFWEPAT